MLIIKVFRYQEISSPVARPPMELHDINNFTIAAPSENPAIGNASPLL